MITTYEEDNYVNKYKALTKKISLLERKFGGNVRLITVSKKQDYKKIIELKRLGQHDFGENYVDEAHDKNIQISDPSISWHFIGKIQSNKIKKCALCLIGSILSHPQSTRLKLMIHVINLKK